MSVNVIYITELTCRGKTAGILSEAAKWLCDIGQRMSEFDSCQFIFIQRTAYITDRLVPICARSNVTFDIGLHVVCTRVSKRAYATS